MVEGSCTTTEQKLQLYWELKTGAETGWDYSSRWFINPSDGGSNHGTLEHTKSRAIIPVDLNSILAENARIISMFYRKYFLDEEQGMKYETISDNIIQGIENLLWNDDEGAWFDFDVINHKQRKYFTPT